MSHKLSHGRYVLGARAAPYLFLTLSATLVCGLSITPPSTAEILLFGLLTSPNLRYPAAALREDVSTSPRPGCALHAQYLERGGSGRMLRDRLQLVSAQQSISMHAVASLGQQCWGRTCGAATAALQILGLHEVASILGTLQLSLQHRQLNSAVSGKRHAQVLHVQCPKLLIWARFYPVWLVWWNCDLSNAGVGVLGAYFDSPFTP
jgi:hypothetical protein